MSLKALVEEHKRWEEERFTEEEKKEFKMFTELGRAFAETLDTKIKEVILNSTN